MRAQTQNGGFTIIELLVVLLVVGILSTLVITTHSGVQAKNRNNNRQLAIDNLQAQLETYYAQYSKYPTLANVNDATWRKANMKDLAQGTLRDPRWKNTNTACTAANNAILSDTAAENCYAYHVTTADGSACDNAAALCAEYTLTVELEGGGKYVKSSLN